VSERQSQGTDRCASPTSSLKHLLPRTTRGAKLAGTVGMSRFPATPRIRSNTSTR